MNRIEGRPILTAAQMRAAEERAIADGASVESLMERAGAGVAEAVRRLSAGAPVLVLCGPGNNGGDGYVAARILRANGVEVRVAALGEPKTAAATAAREAWGGAVGSFEETGPAPVAVDAIFGIGLSRPIDPHLRFQLLHLVAYSALRIAVDVPSGIDSDTGKSLGIGSGYDLTLALGAIKPAHVLQPACGYVGEVRLIELGLEIESEVRVLERPGVINPTSASHKFTRGMVAVIAGVMAGASALAVESALRSGAGYALLLSDDPPNDLPHAIVTRGWSPDALNDARIGAVLIGPGLGRDAKAERLLDTALATDHGLVIDGDALHLLRGDRLNALKSRGNAVLTPHQGEFAALFGAWEGSKIDATRAAAMRSNAHVVFKGADTVIASADGDVVVAPGGNAWLSTAGTGDVLAGVIAAQIAGPIAFKWSVPAAVWMHAEAARRLGGAFIADDLARELSAVRAAL